MCASACIQKTPNLRCRFIKRRLTNTPRRHRLTDGQLSSLDRPSPSVSSFGASPVMLCCSAPPAWSSSPLRPSMHYPSTSLVVNIMHIQPFCEHLNILYIFDQTDLYRVEVRLELNGANARLIVSPPSLTPSYPPTPPPSRSPGLITLPPLAKFQLVWRCLCEALLSSSLVRNIRHLLSTM